MKRENTYVIENEIYECFYGMMYKGNKAKIENRVFLSCEELFFSNSPHFENNDNPYIKTVYDENSYKQVFKSVW